MGSDTFLPFLPFLDFLPLPSPAERQVPHAVSEPLAAPFEARQGTAVRSVHVITRR
jgi:hypothetical protein